MKKHRYSLLYVVAFIVCILLHTSDLFYDHKVMEEADSFAPLWMVLGVVFVAVIIHQFKLLGEGE